jgi:hypothetical protein
MVVVCVGAADKCEAEVNECGVTTSSRSRAMQVELVLRVRRRDWSKTWKL